MPEISTGGVGGPLADDEVRVIALNLDAPPPRVASIERVVSPEERERAARFHRDRDGRRYVVARTAVRVLLGDALGADPISLNLGSTETGRPYLADPAHTEVDFNVSHSGEHALIALSLKRRVGVDIERVRPLSDASSLVNRFFALEERTLFTALPVEMRQDAFFATWTRKEAFAKATGRGIANTLSRFAVSVDPTLPPALIRIDWEDEMPSNWKLVDLPVPPGLSAALAVNGSDWHLQFRSWEAAAQTDHSS